MKKCENYKNNVRVGLSVIFITMMAFSSSAMAKQKPSAKGLKSMARIYMAGGNYEKAKVYSARALSAARDGSQTSLLAGCLMDMAWVELHLGNLLKARSLATEGINRQIATYGASHRYVATSLRTLASIDKEMGNYDKAIGSLLSSMKIMKQQSDFEQRDVAPIQIDYGYCLEMRGELEKASLEYESAFEIIRKVYGPNHIFAANTASRVARFYASIGEYGKAKQLLDMALPVQKEVYGEYNIAMLDSLKTEAIIFESKGERSKSQNAMNQALSLVVKQKGRTSHAAKNIRAMMNSLGTSTAAVASAR